VFWRSFESIYGPGSRRDEPRFVEFYQTGFQQVANDCGFDSGAADAIEKIKAIGFRVALATNPLFPAIATHSRIRWAGLRPDDFELVTTYENSFHCKPNPAYFQDIMDALGVTADQCLMVGNDAMEDTAAEKLGIRVFLLTRDLINKESRDITCYPQGGFPELLDYVKELTKC
jgi:FMN phosphatase YigB (HAD superfamily)